MKKAIKRTLKILLAFILLLTTLVLILFWNEIRSLASMKKVDDYAIFQMTYYGDYGFDDFLEIGATSDSDIEAFVTKRLLKGMPLNFNVAGAGCTVFVARDQQENIIFARNFDFGYAPSMQIVTTPDNGYKSISTVNLTFAGYSKDNLPSGLNPNSFLALAAPYLPFDGMNEKGVAIALLAVPEAELKYDESKITLNTTTAIRLVLDKAATVDEAINLLKNYNIYFSGNIDCHYLIADASGKSVIVEYYEGEMQIVAANNNYQIASNFIAYNGVNIGEGFSEFERYDMVERVLNPQKGIINHQDAIELLAAVGVYEDGIDKLQWSVVYDLTALKGTIFAHRNLDNLIPFTLVD